MPANRLEAVRSYQILGTSPEESFDRITQLASDVFEAPIALLNIATGQNQLWCKSATGWDCAGQYLHLPPCLHVTQHRTLTVVEDWETDDRFATCALPQDTPRVGFYGGVPLHSPDGTCIGTLCILAPESRSFSDADARKLRLLADLAIDLLEKRRHLVDAPSPSDRPPQRSDAFPYDCLREQAHKFAKLKKSVLTNMSHEVRTPLTSMIGFAEILAEELDGRLAEHASVIHRCGRRLHRTLESMMLLSKLEGGVYPLHMRKTDLCKVVHNTADKMQEDARANGVSLTVEAPDVPVTAYADLEATRRVVNNILDNAIKFTPEGGHVQMRVHTDAFTGACIEIEDTGVGISESALPIVFRSFRQESEGVARMYEGIGLGLTIVKHLVERMNGVTRIESQKGTGTRVSIHLPTAPPSPRQTVL